MVVQSLKTYLSDDKLDLLIWGDSLWGWEQMKNASAVGVSKYVNDLKQPWKESVISELPGGFPTLLVGLSPPSGTQRGPACPPPPPPRCPSACFPASAPDGLCLRLTWDGALPIANDYIFCSATGVPRTTMPREGGPRRAPTDGCCLRL